VRGGIFTSKNHTAKNKKTPPQKKPYKNRTLFTPKKTYLSMLKNHFLKNIVLESYKLSRTALQVRLCQKLAKTAQGSRGEDLRKRGNQIFMIVCFLFINNTVFGQYKDEVDFKFRDTTYSYYAGGGTDTVTIDKLGRTMVFKSRRFISKTDFYKTTFINFKNQFPAYNPITYHFRKVVSRDLPLKYSNEKGFGLQDKDSIMYKIEKSIHYGDTTIENNTAFLLDGLWYKMYSVSYNSKGVVISADSTLLMDGKEMYKKVWYYANGKKCIENIDDRLTAFYDTGQPLYELVRYKDANFGFNSICLDDRGHINGDMAACLLNISHTSAAPMYPHLVKNGKYTQWGRNGKKIVGGKIKNYRKVGTWTESILKKQYSVPMVSNDYTYMFDIIKVKYLINMPIGKSKFLEVKIRSR
jgi:hypothetical protein